MGYFYEFKLHFVSNDKGEMLIFIISSENTNAKYSL
ncbi:MAG: hypothetical protein GQ564_17575 [Bacteroidales bacterium]|nr:hypothetical protein [Bacteroidales bacterium]